MSKSLMLVMCMVLFYKLSYSQDSYTLKGIVVDENNVALTSVAVVLHPSNKGTITDSVGHFHFTNLQAGEYTIHISFIGYKPYEETVKLNGNTTYKAKLSVAYLNLQEVTITDNYAEKRKKEESLNIEIVNDQYLKQNLGGSLMNSLERLPGVTTIDIGSGQSKPVIRGLGFNRVVVVENNIKHEAQQWGADHGLEIDQYAVENIEVIKGPSSLMYGADAIGGVIDIKNRKTPINNRYGGVVDITGKSNNNLLGSSVMVYGRKNTLFGSIRATLLDYADYKVPADYVDVYGYKVPLYNNELRNTAGKEQNLHLNFGIIKDKFKSRFNVSNVHTKSGFFANAHGLEPQQVDTAMHDKSNRDILLPYQQVNHFKVTNTSSYTFDKLKLMLDIGYQHNFRQEWSRYGSHGWMPPVFPDTLDFHKNIEREFDKKVYSGNAKAFYALNEKTQLIVGFNSEFQDNQIDGRGFLMPAYQQLTMGGYAIAKHAISKKSMIQAGIRYDYGRIQINEYTDWYQTQVVEGNDTTMQYLQRADYMDRQYSNISWSVGYNYNPGKWSYKFNVGKSYRMPTAKELGANGVNYHYFRYEVGNSNLSPETSYQLDAGIEFANQTFAIGTTPFINYFPNYIYLNPTPYHNREQGAGFQIFEYTQSEVFRYGGEIHAHYEPIKHLQLGIMAEYVYSLQLSGKKEGFTIPFSPPASALINLKYHRTRISVIDNPYLTIDYRLTATQNNIVPPEEVTPGYQLINLGMGGEIKLGRQKVMLSMQVQNLLNREYLDHTSFYRLINVPEAGRNFIVNISIPFSGAI
ncbi:TonB-dependent receptor [Carboxylicivirga marina]|uniref:TonB-dependent receptor n=1 Tax=Carboxylicivirga marina TaxID=2800988 RepID=UPI002592E558|nr:TonB-dependent receptor [uncultured Carboxylicivirga sp.]